MIFTRAERDYLTSQRLGRLVTLAPDGAPQAKPVGYSVDEESGRIDVGGYNLEQSQKYRNILRDGRVTLLVDDLASVDPWTPRGVEIRGHAEVVRDTSPPRKGQLRTVIRIRPSRILSWGLDSDGFGPPNARDVGPDD